MQPENTSAINTGSSLHEPTGRPGPTAGLRKGPVALPIAAVTARLDATQRITNRTRQRLTDTTP